MNRINGISDGKGGLDAPSLPAIPNARTGHAWGIRGAGDAGRRDNPVHPVILSNLYSRQDEQD